MKRVVAVALVAALLLSSCSFFKSDEQKMEDKIEKFITSYNSGDVDGMIDTLDSQSRHVAEASLSIADSLLGSLTGIGISVKDVFSLCINFSDDFDTLKILSFDDFQIEADAATVYVTVEGSQAGEESIQQAVFKMVKESRDWYINDFSNIGGV